MESTKILPYLRERLTRAMHDALGDWQFYAALIGLLITIAPHLAPATSPVREWLSLSVPVWIVATLALAVWLFSLGRRYMSASRSTGNVQLFSSGEEIRSSQTNNQASFEAVSRKEEYERFRTPGGAIVWKSKTEPAHYVCPKCFEWGRFVPLQMSAGTQWTGNYDCPACDKSFQIEQRRDLPVQRARTDYDPFS